MWLGVVLQMRFICLPRLKSEIRNVDGRRIYFFPVFLLTVGFISSLVQPYLTHLMKKALKLPFIHIYLPLHPSYSVTTGALKGPPGIPAAGRGRVSPPPFFFFFFEGTGKVGADKGDRNIIMH